MKKMIEEVSEKIDFSSDKSDKEKPTRAKLEKKANKNKHEKDTKLTKLSEIVTETQTPSDSSMEREEEVEIKKPTAESVMKSRKKRIVSRMTNSNSQVPEL